MAIKGFNSVEIQNNVPFNNDPGQTINEGDMLYWSKKFQAFQAGPGKHKLSDLENDSGYITREQLDELLLVAASGGSITLDTLATMDEVNAALDAAGQHFDGTWDSLTGKPEIPSVEGLASSAYVDFKINSLPLFSGNYQDLTNKPSLFSGSYLDLTDRPVLFNGDYNSLTNKPDFSLYASKNYVDTAIAGVVPDTSHLASKSYVDAEIAIIHEQHTADNTALANAIDALQVGDVDLINYYTKQEVDTALANITVDIDLTPYALKSELFSGSYDDLTNKPFIPDLTGYATITYVNSRIIDTAPDLTPYATTEEMNTAIDAKFALVPDRFSGDYNDLINKPTIFSGSYLDLTDRPILFSGDYNDLTNKPDHSVYASTTYVDEKIVEALSGGSIDLTSYVTDQELATALSNYQPTIDLTSYYTKSEVDLALQNVSVDLTGYATTNDLNNAIAGIQHPTNVSEFLNDSGYVTQTYLTNTLANYQPTVDLTSYYTKQEVDNLLLTIDNVDTTGLATQTYVNQQISQATLAAVGQLDDLNDVAIGSLPTIDNADDFYLLEYNPTTKMWESRNFGGIFATESYVSATVATALTNGEINLDGYATEQFVEQKLVERGDHFSGNYYDLTNRPQLFSGSYNDLINKPTLNAYTLTSTGTSLNLVETRNQPNTVVATIDFGDLGIAFSGNYEDLTNKPILFSGNYADLANKPYIPSIAGLASEEYVDNRWAEPVITGERTFTHGLVFEDFVQQKLSTVNAEASKRELVLAVQTINSIETEVLFSDASRVNIVSGTTAMFKATVVASSGTDKTAFIVKGVIDYTGAGISIVGNNIIETISDSDLGWTADFTADSTNESLKITVRGSESMTIDWTVFLEISEVIR